MVHVWKEYLNLNEEQPTLSVQFIEGSHYSTYWHAELMSLTLNKRMFFDQTSTQPPSVHQKLTENGQC